MKVKRTKAIIAAVGLVVQALTEAFADDVLDVSDGSKLVAQVVAAGLAVYLVWRVPNEPLPRREQ